MAKKGGTTTTVNTGLDKASQAYVDQMRRAAAAGTSALPTGSQNPLDLVKGYMNPYESSVVDATRADYDRSRGMADVAARQDAIAGGAFGDDRASQARGARVGEIDRGEAADLAGLRYQGYNDALAQATARGQYTDQLPYWQLQQRLQGLNLGMGPTGSTQTTNTQKTGGWGDALQAGLGLATTFFPPAGLAAGAAKLGSNIFAGQQPGAIPAQVANGPRPGSLFDGVRLGNWGGGY